jgi:hypothetical protein
VRATPEPADRVSTASPEAGSAMTTPRLAIVAIILILVVVFWR